MPTNESTEFDQVQPVDNLLSRASSEGEEDAWGGKRSWSRWKAGLLLEVTANPHDPKAVQKASMHDVSSGGIGLWSRTEWLARAAIYVREAGHETPQPWLAGTVMHATRGLRGFLVGVALEQQLPE